ncbi:MAG: hypothetical protein R3E12_14610 [Candidatus Eisenbacteria bacterium]
MFLFEIFFLLLVLTTVVSLVLAGIAALRGRLARAGGILRRLAIGAGLYLVALVVASIVMPRAVYPVGQRQCFDDWCIGVVDSHLEQHGEAGAIMEVTLELSSRARRRPQRELGTAVYVVDRTGKRYEPLPEPNQPPLDVLLGPGERVTTVRRFPVPDGAHDLSLLYVHEGFPIGWFVIGEGGWFAKPATMELPN